MLEEDREKYMMNKKPAGLENHLVELRKKHAALSAEVDKLVRVPGCCNLELSELKKQKFRLKEEIERLEKIHKSSDSPSHAAMAVKEMSDLSESSNDDDVGESGDYKQEAA